MEFRIRDFSHIMCARYDRPQGLRVEERVPNLLGRGRNLCLAATVKCAAAFLLQGCGHARWRLALSRMNMRRKLRRRERQIDVGKPERVGHRIGDADWGAHAVALADALRAKRRKWRWRFQM